MKIEVQDLSKSQTSNTDINHTDISNTEYLIYPREDENGSETYEHYVNFFKEQLDYEFLMRNNPMDEDTLEGMIDMLAEVCSCGRDEILVAGDRKPRNVVASRLMKLNSEHIQYVMDCLKKTTTEVRNIKQYLLTALFNAPVTHSPYYRVQVNHDFYGQKPQ